MRILVARLPYLQSQVPDQIDDYINQQRPKKEKFASMCEMPKTTTEKCWQCLFSFDTQPMAIVLEKLEAQSSSTTSYWYIMGNFCSLCCCRGFCDAQERFRSRPQQAYDWLLEFAFYLGLLPECKSVQDAERCLPIVMGAPPPQGMLSCMGGCIPNARVFRSLFCNDNHQNKNVGIVPFLPNSRFLNERHMNVHPLYTCTNHSLDDIASNISVTTTLRFRYWSPEDCNHYYHHSLPIKQTQKQTLQEHLLENELESASSQTKEEEKQLEASMPFGFTPKTTFAIPYRLFANASEYQLRPCPWTCMQCCREQDFHCVLPLPAPIARSVAGFEVFGQFCSPACAYGYLYADERFRETCAPLCFEFFYELGRTDGCPFLPAPKPFDVLKEFGGTYSSQQYQDAFCSNTSLASLLATEPLLPVYVVSWGFVFTIPNPRDAESFLAACSSSILSSETMHASLPKEEEEFLSKPIGLKKKE